MESFTHNRVENRPVVKAMINTLSFNERLLLAHPGKPTTERFTRVTGAREPFVHEGLILPDMPLTGVFLTALAHLAHT